MEVLFSMVAVLGATFFLWFALPFVMKGIINIGNITGMLLSVMICGYGICHARVHVWMAEIWQNEMGRGMVIAVSLLVFCVIVCIMKLTIGMVRAASNHPPKDTTVIVLGCRVKGGRLSRVLQERLDTAYEYLVENPECCCVLSGGKVRGENVSEAVCMYQYLTAKGIAEERLILEDKSSNTKENLQFSYDILKESGITGAVTIVTSEFHAYRAHKEAERLGIQSYSTPSHTFFLYLPTYYVRELYGIVFYMLK